MGHRNIRCEAHIGTHPAHIGFAPAHVTDFGGDPIETASMCALSQRM